MGDVVVIVRFSSNWEDRTRLLSQRSLRNGDLQGREPLYRNNGSISLSKIGKCEDRETSGLGEGAYPLNAPAKVVSQVRYDDVRFV
jgi:hypothetical protein